MRTITIDHSKCTGDAICVKECPIKLYTISTNGLAESTPNAGKNCIGCGHCLSACKAGAITIDDMNAANLAPIQPELLPTFPQFEHLALTRRSTRYFTNESVESSDIEKLIHASSYAPTGHNSEPVEWIIIHNKQQVRALAQHVIDWMNVVIEHDPNTANMLHFPNIVAAWTAGVDMVFRGAPHVAVVHADNNKISAQYSCVIAITHFELAAHAMNLGAVWAGYAQYAAQTYKPIQEFLGIPEGHTVHGAMMLGHNAVKYHYIPKRKTPVVSWM